MLYGLMADDIERVRQAALKDPAQLVRFADLLVAQGRAEEAVSACRKGLSSRPDDVALRLALGRALSAAGHLEEAQAALLDAVARQQKAAAGGAKVGPPPDSGPVIQDPSIEEEIELPRGHAANVPSPDSFDDVPTSVAEISEPIRRAAESSMRSTQPPGERGRVTTLPGRRPSGNVPAVDPHGSTVPPPARTDRVTTLPERNSSPPGARMHNNTERGTPVARDWPGPPSDSIEIEPEQQTRPDTPVPRDKPKTATARAPAPIRDEPPVRNTPRRAPEAIVSTPQSRARTTAPPVAPTPAARVEPLGPIDLLSTAHTLLGEVDDDSLSAPVDELFAPPVPDEMTRAWDARRGRAFVWLWAALVL
jgi:hypothetical protein